MDENQNKLINLLTASGPFDAWTLVTEDPPVVENNNQSTSNESDTKRIENLEKKDNFKSPEIPAEELSDGISVISETESIEECNEKYASFILNTNSNESDIHNLNIEKHVANKNLHLDKLQEQSINSNEFTNCLNVKNFVSGIFYVGLLAAILGFIGQLRGLHDEKFLTEISSIKERVENLELNNNLLRAEIDILQKKITYLINQQNINTNQYSKHKYHENSFQPESNLKEKNINPNENQEYKHKINNKPDIVSGCENNERFINGVCVVKDQQGTDENSFDKPSMKINSNNRDKNYEKNVYNEQNKRPAIRSKEEGKESHNFKNNDKYSKKKSDDISVESNEHFDKRRHSSEKYKFDKNQQKNANKYDDDKKGRFNSKEFKQGQYKENNKFDKRIDNDWHEKLMDSRETYRKQKSNGNNNWFVERGHSREEFRMFEDDYKRKGK